MHEVTFIFRNGVVFTAQAEKLTVTHGTHTNDLRGLKWEGMEPDPLYIDLAEVAAVFVGQNTGTEPK